jgi:hypothetical protein
VPVIIAISNFVRLQNIVAFEYFVNDYFSQAYAGIITCGLGGLVWDIKSRLQRSVNP